MLTWFRNNQNENLKTGFPYRFYANLIGPHLLQMTCVVWSNEYQHGDECAPVDLGAGAPRRRRDSHVKTRRKGSGWYVPVALGTPSTVDARFSPPTPPDLPTLTLEKCASDASRTGKYACAQILKSPLPPPGRWNLHRGRRPARVAHHVIRRGIPATGRRRLGVGEPRTKRRRRPALRRGLEEKNQGWGEAQGGRAR